MKNKIREEILYKRSKISEREKGPKDTIMVESIEALPEFVNAQEILIYIPIHGEVDVTTLFKNHSAKKKFVLPRTESKSKALNLYKIDSLDDLIKGTYDIPEPKSHLPKVPPEDIDLAIIPGVAFAKDGHRVGYGGGFYDRLIKKLKCPTIGVAYNFQIVNNIQGEDHDEQVDILVTEDGATRISTS